MAEWISVNDRLPEEVLAQGGGGMRILRSTPFVLLYISVAILVVGCVLGGMEEAFKPFEIELVALALGTVGTIFTIITTCLAGYYLYKKIEDGEIEDDDDGN